VSLPLPGQSHGPPTCPNSMNDGGPNCGNWSLKSFKVPDRPHPVYSLAVRTSKPPQQGSFFEPIEEGLDKTVKPESRTTTPGTQIGPGPRKISFQPKNIIEGNAASQYHWVTCLRVHPGPYMLRAVAPPSHRPLHITAHAWTRSPVQLR
jgi:hypothetical protein